MIRQFAISICTIVVTWPAYCSDSNAVDTGSRNRGISDAPTLSGAASQRWHSWRKSRQELSLAAWSYFFRYPGTVEEYKVYRDAGLNMVETSLAQYDNAVAAGLHPLLGWKGDDIADRPKLLAKCVNFSSPEDSKLWGSVLYDDPNPEQFNKLAAAINYIYKNDSRDLIPIIDMLPNWAWQRHDNRVEGFGRHYSAMLADYIGTVHPAVLLNCHYPPLPDGNDRPEYYANLELYRDYALRNNIGLMGFVLVTELKGIYRQPSDSDLRWQVYTSLAYGAQGIWYYNYRIKPADYLVGGMVDHNTGLPRKEYYQVKALNSEVNAIGRILMQLRSQSVMHTGDIVPDCCRRYSNSADSGWSAMESFSAKDFIIADFVNQDDPCDRDAYIMLVNKRHGKDLPSTDKSLVATASFRISRQYKHLYEYDRTNGNPVELSPIKGQNRTYSITLGGGQGTLLRLCSLEIKQTSSVQQMKERPTIIAKFLPPTSQNGGMSEQARWRGAISYNLSLSTDKTASGKQLREAGKAMVGWDSNSLYVRADFEDSDILAKGDKDGLEHYLLGDVLEVFLKPADRSWYWEIWASPRGKKTSLFWAERGKMGSEVGQDRHLSILASADINGTLNDSSDRDKSWACELAIPIKDLTAPGAAFTPGEEWLILIARQNYSGQVDLSHRELSMFPALSKSDYHLYEQYATLRLAE
jgi:hypothetical protein